MADGLYNANDSDLKTLNYINSSGQGQDLRAIYLELNIFEDIFATVMSGNLIVNDSRNLFGYMPAIGNEFLVIDLDKPGMGNPIQKKFRIYNISKIAIEKPTAKTIRIDFCSEELLVSKSITFSKSYNQMLISDMVKDITKTYLKIPDKKLYTIEATKGITNLTTPNFNPMQTLNWLASKARSNYVGATYLFYEDKDGFAFQSLQKLMDTSNPVKTFNYNIKNVIHGDIPTDFADVASYEIVNTPNTLHGLDHGKYSGTLYTFDPLRGKFSTGQLNADDLYKASVTLGQGKPFNNFLNLVKKVTADSYGGYKKYYPTNLGQNDSKISPYIAGKQNIQPTNVESWLLERNAQLLQIMNIRVKIAVAGDPSLKVGNVVRFNMPSIEDVDPSKRKLDPLYSGLYIITAIRHKVDIRNYECIIELAKDSLTNSVPEARFSDFNSGILNV